MALDVVNARDENSLCKEYSIKCKEKKLKKNNNNNNVFPLACEHSFTLFSELNENSLLLSENVLLFLVAQPLSFL